MRKNEYLPEPSDRKFISDHTRCKKDLNHEIQFIMTIACLKKNLKRSFLFVSYYMHTLKF